MTEFEDSAKIPTLRDIVSLPFKFFSAVGIKFFNWDEKDLMTTKEKIVLFLISTNCTINFVSMCGYVIFDTFEDTVQISEWSLYMNYGVNGFFKVCSVIWGRKTLSRSLKSLELLFLRSSKECLGFNFNQGSLYIKRHAKIMATMLFSITLIFNILPVMQSSVEYWRTGLFTARLPFILTYPFDINYSVNYILGYTSQIIASLTIVCYFVASDMLLICTIFAVILQFKYLCFRIEHFESKNCEKDMCELREILENHNILNKLARDVNGVFSVSILLNYMLTIIVIVLLGIQIVFGSELLHSIKFVGLFSVSAMEMYYVCMFGEQLLATSTLLGEAFAGQKWYMAEVSYQRMLCLAIARSQKPAHLTAYKFFVISRESFSNLMTTAYQFFTLLKARMEEI